MTVGMGRNHHASRLTNLNVSARKIQEYTNPRHGTTHPQPQLSVLCWLHNLLSQSYISLEIHIYMYIGHVFHAEFQCALSARACWNYDQCSFSSIISVLNSPSSSPHRVRNMLSQKKLPQQWNLGFWRVWSGVDFEFATTKNGGRQSRKQTRRPTRKGNAGEMGLSIVCGAERVQTTHPCKRTNLHIKCLHGVFCPQGHIQHTLKTTYS